MFLFKNKKKKKSSQDVLNQEPANNDVYVQDDHLLNIKLPEDFSSIILPQLIGYEQDENGNTINSSTIILRQKQQQQQQQQIQTEENHHHQHSVPTREGWYPVTRFVGSESNRGTLVDTTNITAASLVQVNQRESASLSSSSGDTFTCHSKEDCTHSLDLDKPHPSLFYLQHQHPFSCHMPHLRKDRPKFKRNYPRRTILKVEINQPSEIVPSQIEFKSRSDESPTSGTTLKKSLKPPTCFSLPESSNAQSENSIPITNKPLIKGNEDKKVKPAAPCDKKRRIGGIKLSNEPELKLRIRQKHHQQNKKASTTAIPPSSTTTTTINTEDAGSMIPRRPLSSYSSHNDNPTAITVPATSKMKKNKQSRAMTMSINNNNNNTMGGGSRIPVRSQTMKV